MEKLRVFNGHSDLPAAIAEDRLENRTHVLKERFHREFQEGCIGGGIFVVWTPQCEVPHYEQWTDRVIQEAKQDLAEYGEQVQLVQSWADYEKGLEAGRLNWIFGLEGLAQIGSQVDKLEAYYEAGFRHASLTWNECNELASGQGHEGGLSRYGKDAVQLMQDLGMIVDVSHLNDEGFWDVIKLGKKPIMASHSNCRSLCRHKRNLTDDQLRAIQASGGVVGLNAYKPFVHDEAALQRMEGLALQLEHMADIMGIDHVGFGFDFSDMLSPHTLGGLQLGEGESLMVEGLQSEQNVPYLLDFLRQRGFTETELAKISHQNMERVVRDNL